MRHITAHKFKQLFKVKPEKVFDVEKEFLPGVRFRIEKDPKARFLQAHFGEITDKGGEGHHYHYMLRIQWSTHEDKPHWKITDVFFFENVLEMKKAKKEFA